MSGQAPSDEVFATTWVHVAERDTADGEVYVPDSERIPLSRRPRTRLELRQDGTATLYEGGPDDRPRGRPATWTSDPGLRTGADLLIVSSTPGRLVVRRLG